MKWDLVKILSAVLVVLLIINMILFALKKTNGWFFWLTIILAAAYAFWILPRMNKVEKGNKSRRR